MSMISCDNLYDIHRRLCDIFVDSDDDPFGGKAVILLGDIMQLPPVKGRTIFSEPRCKKRRALFSIDNQSLWQNMTVFTLTTNHRQGQLSQLSKCLNEIRCLESIDDLSQEYIDLLESRRLKDDNVVENAVYVFYSNVEVEEHNTKMMNSLPGNLFVSKAKVVHDRNYKYKVTPHGTIDDTNFLEYLKLKKGARVMLTFNVNIIDSLVNGAMGTVTDIEFQKAAENQENPEVNAYIVSFDDPHVGEEHRRKNKDVSEKYAHCHGTHIYRSRLDYYPRKTTQHKNQVSIFQFPLRPADASTGHKLQGVTIKDGENLVVNGHPRMPSGMGYVMLSRNSNIDNLYLSKNFDLKKSLRSNEFSRREKLNLDQRAIKYLHEKGTPDIFYVNIRSLNKNHINLMNDVSALNCKFICLVETWLTETDEREDLGIPGFTCVNAPKGHGKGCCLFIKDTEDWTMLLCEVRDKFQIISIEISEKKVQLSVLYLSSSVSKADLSELQGMLESNLSEELEQIILGDLNFDRSEINSLSKYFNAKGLIQKIERPTREKNRTIDHVYVSKENLIEKLNVQSVYYSDHSSIKIKMM